MVDLIETRIDEEKETRSLNGMKHRIFFLKYIANDRHDKKSIINSPS